MRAITEQNLRSAAARAVARGHAVAVVLFGSRARGTAGDASDWDVCLVTDGAAGDALANDRGLAAADPFWEGPQIETHWLARARFEHGVPAGSLEAAIVRDGRLLAGESAMATKARTIPFEAQTVLRNLDRASEHLHTSIDAALRHAVETDDDQRNAIAGRCARGSGRRGTSTTPGSTTRCTGTAAKARDASAGRGDTARGRRQRSMTWPIRTHCRGTSPTPRPGSSNTSRPKLRRRRSPSGGAAPHHRRGARAHRHLDHRNLHHRDRGRGARARRAGMAVTETECHPVDLTPATNRHHYITQALCLDDEETGGAAESHGVAAIMRTSTWPCRCARWDLRGTLARARSRTSSMAICSVTAS